jgi:hypothetical protein
MTATTTTTNENYNAPPRTSANSQERPQTLTAFVRLSLGRFLVEIVCHLGCMAMRDATDVPRAEPVITVRLVHDYPANNNVCVRPLLRQVTDRETGDVQRLVIPCGSTREAVCRACAEKARRLRM